jgi:hypothetical protein
MFLKRRGAGDFFLASDSAESIFKKKISADSAAPTERTVTYVIQRPPFYWALLLPIIPPASLLYIALSHVVSFLGPLRG